MFFNREIPPSQGDSYAILDSKEDRVLIWEWKDELDQ